MDLKLLNYFMQVAGCGSMNRAAKALDMTQPALARHINRLEHQLGHSLFFRSPGGMYLTEAGQRLAQSAPQLLDQASSIRELLDGEPSGQVTLGAPSSMLHLVVVPTVRNIQRTAPRLILRLIENNSGELRKSMDQGVMDLAIVLATADAATGFDEVELVKEPLVLIRSNSLGPQPETCDIAALADYPLVCPTRPSMLRAVIEATLRKANLPFRLAIEGESLALVSEMVKLGVGQAVLPACALFQLPNLSDFTVSVIDGQSARWVLRINRRRAQALAVRRTMGILLKIVEQQRENGSWPLSNAEGRRNAAPGQLRSVAGLGA